MATDNVTPIRPSIEGEPLEEAIDEQCMALFDVQAIIDLAAVALQELSDEPGNPHYSNALRRVSKSIGAIVEALEAGPLEERALAIAQAKRDESAEAAS